MNTKFGDMPQGTHFKDSLRTCFIKLMNTLPSGLPLVCESSTDKDRKFTRGTFNAVYYKGTPANVPDWREYQVFTPSI